MRWHHHRTLQINCCKRRPIFAWRKIGFHKGAPGRGSAFCTTMGLVQLCEDINYLLTILCSFCNLSDKQRDFGFSSYTVCFYREAWPVLVRPLRCCYCSWNVQVLLWAWSVERNDLLRVAMRGLLVSRFTKLHLSNIGRSLRKQWPCL